MLACGPALPAVSSGNSARMISLHILHILSSSIDLVCSRVLKHAFEDEFTEPIKRKVELALVLPEVGQSNVQLRLFSGYLGYSTREG